jgi:putative endonuclease
MWRFLRPVALVQSFFRPLTLGERGEREACRYLRRLGYIIVARTSRFRRGELDIVAVDGRTVVFVEVKTRRSSDPGDPLEAVTPEKQRRLTRAALLYLKRHRLLKHSARFDVLAVTWANLKKPPEIQHIKNAFEAADLDGG